MYGLPARLALACRISPDDPQPSITFERLEKELEGTRIQKENHVDTSSHMIRVKINRN